jgi:hypothetical protein
MLSVIQMSVVAPNRKTYNKYHFMLQLQKS